MEKNFEVLHEAVDTLKNTNETLSAELLDLVEKLEEKIEANELEEVIDTEEKIQKFLTKHEKAIEKEVSLESIQT